MLALVSTQQCWQGSITQGAMLLSGEVQPRNEGSYMKAIKTKTGYVEGQLETVKHDIRAVN